MSDPPLAACPECGGAGTRLFYPTGILFKGSGFYKTDSRPDQAVAPSPGTETSKPASDGTSDSKPSKPAKDSTKDVPTPSPTTTTTHPSPAPKPSAAD
jgi:predicted nucleic acid-binding Zn ribbon protein